MTPFLLLFALPILARAYSWHFTSNPVQCQNLSLAIDGAGTPPYRVFIIPFGPSPLPRNIEVRRIISQDFPDHATQLSFQLDYPANSQFVAVVSDATGFGSGGTSVAAQVLASPVDVSCFDASNNVAPLFYLNIDPPNQIVQCTPTRIWWDPATVSGTPQFVGIIPGGQSFSIPIPSTGLTTSPNLGTGFEWTPSVRGSTTLLLAAGDARGPGAGGSILTTVSFGPFPNADCLSNTSPSSTSAPPAGGVYPTNSVGAQTSGDPQPVATPGPSGSASPGSSSSNPSTPVGSSSTSANNTSAIIGGALGGLLLLLLVLLGLFFFFQRRRRRVSGQFSSIKERSIDLLRGQEDDPLEFYHPAPFVPPYSTSFGDSIGAGAGAGAQHARGLSADSTNTTNTTDGPPMSGCFDSSAAHTGVTTPDIYPNDYPYYPGAPRERTDGHTGNPNTGTGTGLRTTRWSLRKSPLPPAVPHPPGPAPPSTDAHSTPTTAAVTTGADAPPVADTDTGTGTHPAERPVRVIQHDDAGPPRPGYLGGHGQEAEVVELPPAYSLLRMRNPSPSPGLGPGPGQRPTLPLQRTPPVGPLLPPPPPPPMLRSMSSPQPSAVPRVG